MLKNITLNIILFGGTSTTSRLNSFRVALAKKVKDPSVLGDQPMKVFEAFYTVHLGLPKDTVKTFEDMRRAFINVFGEETYLYFLAYSYFFHSNANMAKKGYKDGIYDYNVLTR